MTKAKKKNTRLIIISSPSGGGKSTICKKLKEKKPELEYSVSTTTRLPRQGEKNGEEYFFVSKNEFENMIKKNAFLEWAEVHGNYYGTSRKNIENCIKLGKTCILDIDVQGAMQVQKKYPDALFIFLMPPSIKELENRLIKRGTDNKEAVKIRLNNAANEMECKKYYDYTIINNKIEDTVNKIVEILNKNLYI